PPTPRYTLSPYTTLFRSRMNLARQVAEEVRTHFGEKVYRTVIPRNVRLSEAPSFGKPIILYDIRSRGRIIGLPNDGASLRRTLRSEEHTSELQSQSNLVC